MFVHKDSLSTVQSTPPRTSYRNCPATPFVWQTASGVNLPHTCRGPCHVTVQRGRAGILAAIRGILTEIFSATRKAVLRIQPFIATGGSHRGRRGEIPILSQCN